MTIAEMCGELEAAGYLISRGGMSLSITIISPNGWIWTCPTTNPERIEYAYKHLQEKRKFEAMKGLLNEMIETFGNPMNSQLNPDLINAKGALDFMRFVSKSKLILDGDE